jgi:amidase/aspartyl-tRNA(Asn)/glutamyl-tRNA(Gln) amidotransferase subunit A
VYGYKGTFGLTPLASRPNAFANAAPFIFEGPLTRNVKDAALALSAQAGFDPRDPFSVDVPFDPLGALDRPIGGLRIAYTRDFGIFPVDPRVVAVVDEAVRVFEDLGAHVETVDPQIPHSQQELSDLWCRLVSHLNVAMIADIKAAGFDLARDHHDDLPPQVWEWAEKTRALTVADYFADQAMRTDVFDALAAVLDTHDLIVSPTLACLPVKNAEDGNTVGPSAINGEAIDPLIGWCMTYLMNYTGFPAASVPAGMAGNLPVGMQIAGRRFADETVLAASAAFERARPWLDTYMEVAV